MKIILQNKIKATSILNIEELKLSKFMTTKNLKKKFKKIVHIFMMHEMTRNVKERIFRALSLRSAAPMRECP